MTAPTDDECFFRCPTCGHCMYPCRGEDATGSVLFNNLGCLRKCCERVLIPVQAADDDETAEFVLEKIVSASGTDGLAPECLLPDDQGFTALSMFTKNRTLPVDWKYFVALAARCPELVHHPTRYGSTPLSVVAVNMSPNMECPEDAYIRRLVDLPASVDGWRSTMRDIVHYRMSYTSPKKLLWVRRDVFARGVHRLGRHDTRALIEGEFDIVVGVAAANSWTADAAKVKGQLLDLCDELCGSSGSANPENHIDALAAE